MKRFIECLQDGTAAICIALLLFYAIGAWIDEPDFYNPPPARSASK